MPVNDGSNISIAGPRGGLTTTDPFQQASKLFSAMRRASGGGGGTNAAVAASLGLPPNAKIDWMLDPQSGEYVPVVGGTDELRKYNLAAAKQRRAIEAINSEKGAGIRAKLEGFGGKSAEKQASILNDIRTNDIPKLSKDAQVDGSDLIAYGLADYSRMQKENAANVAKTGTGDILWDSLRIGARNFMDSVADIFSDSNEQLARANLRQQYIRDIQDNNAFLRNRALQQQEGAGFLDRFGWGELAATTGEFLAENAPVLAATALTGGAAGLAARGLGAAAATAGRVSMLGSAVGGAATGMPTQLGSAINEIAADNKLTEDQKLQALDEAYGPSLGAGFVLGSVVMPFGQYISRGIGSGLARAGVGNSNVAKMVRSRRAGEALPTGTNNWDEAMAMARRNDILAENEAIANQRLYRGMLGRRLRDSAIEGSLLSGASQMATNAAVGNSLMENVGPATIGGAIGGALFTPFNRRTAMGVPDDVIGQRTAERQKLVDLFAARNAAMGGDVRSFDDQTIGAMEAWDALAGARGADVLSGANPMTPEQREAYLRQQSYDDLLLNRMVAHEAAVRERERLAAEAAQARQDEARRVADFWRQHSDTLLQAEFTPRSIFDVMPDAIPNTTPDPVLPRAQVTTPLDAEWSRMERERAIARDAARIRSLINEANIPSRMEYADYAGRDIFDTTPANLDRIAAEDAARAEAQRSLLAQQAANLRNVWSLDPVRRAIETPRSYSRSTPDLDAEWAANEDVLRQIQSLVPTDTRTSLVNTLAGIRNLRNDAIARQEWIDYRVPGLVQAWDAAPPSLMDPRVPRYVRNTPELDAEWRDEAIRRINNSILNQGNLGNRLALPAALPFNTEGIALPVGTGRTTAGDAWVGPSLMDAVASSQETPTPYKYTRVMNNAERSALRQGREGVARTLGAIRDVRQKDLDFGNAVLDVKQAWDAANPIALDPRYRFYVRSTPDLDAEWAANEAVLRQIQEQVPAETRSSLLGTLRGVRNQRNDDVLRQEFRNRGYTRRTPELDAEWAQRSAAQEQRRADSRERTEQQQKVVDTLAALRERRNNTELRNERLINTGIAQEYYFNRIRDQQFRRDFTIYEGEVLLENNPGVLPTNNYLPENVAAVVENLGEPRIAETMLDGTPATDQRPKPQRPYTKAITYVSSDDALRKFTGKLRGRESMIPRDVREEQMGWMNDILAAGTGKGRISAQGVLAKDVRDTLDKIVDAQTVDSAMRLDELLLTRLRGSEDTSLFNRAQRAAMQYVRNRIYANMDDYAYQNKLGRYGEIDANTPENTDPTGGGGSPTSGMGGTESAGAEPTVDNNLSNDSGGPTNSAGVSEATAGQLPDSTVTDSAAVEERGDAGTKTPDSGEDTTLEGDSAAKTAQQQTADGKRSAGDAARVDAATNPRTGSDRIAGSSEQGDDRNAADTGSNGQSGSRTEPEDGEPVEVEHTDDWPWDDPEYEEGARDEIRVDKKTGEIGFRLNRLYDNYGEWYSYGIRDMFVPKSQKADPDDGSSPTAYVTFKNANGDTYELSFDYYKKEGNTPAHWSETSENTPGIRIDPKGYVWVNLREVPEEMQRAASGFEARVEIRLTDDEGGDVAEGGFPILPEEYPIKATAESRPAPQTDAANPVVNEQQVPQGDTAKPTETPAVEPKGLSSAEEIAARQTNPDVVPTQGVDPESNEALSWAARQEGNRSHVEDDDPNSMITPSESEYGSEYENLTDGAKEYTARNIRSNTSKTQISVSTKDANTVGNVKVFPGYIRVTVRRPYSQTNERINVDFNLGAISKMYNGTATKSKDRNGGYTWSLQEARPETASRTRNEYLKGVEINNFSGDKRIINKWEEPPQSDLNEYLYIYLDDWDRVNHFDGTESFSVNVTTGYDRVYSIGKVMHFEGTVGRNKLTNDNTMQAATQGTLRTLISANAEPTKQNVEAAQKVVKESGSIDAREAFLEDTAAANATITAKDSLKDSAKKKLQKAKQELPQLPIDTPAPTTESPSVFGERFSRTIADMEQQYTRNGHSLDNFIKGAASSGASAKRIIAKRNASDASWREDLRDDMAETAARLGIMRSTGLFGEVKRGSPLARKEEFFANNNIPLIEPNSEMAQHLKEYFGAMPARERKITQAIDYVLRNPTAQKMDIINHPERSVC